MGLATGEVSYDLWGAALAGVKPSWNVKHGDGVWWGGPWTTYSGTYWEKKC